ncbi:GAF domain-containing protein, partial [bacterium]|nr:GAF domain-containing protein [bacterium]MBU1615356.1 GAF domain-containing protein [bacterium]
MSNDFKKHLEDLNKIGIALSAEHNLDRLLEMIVRKVRHFTRADAGSLYIKEEDSLNFVVAQNDTLDRKDPGRAPFKSFKLEISKKSIAGYAALTGELLNISDVYSLSKTTPYQFDSSFDRNMNYRTGSMLVVPMKDHQDEIIGVLQLINSLNKEGNPVPFEKEYEGLVSSLASQAAVAIRNAKLIEEIKNLFKRLVEYSASAIDARSPHTAGHSRRVATYAMRIAKAINEEKEGHFAKINFSDEELEELNYAAWLHDIGKIGVREHVLEKSDKLSLGRMEAIDNRFSYIKKSLENEVLTKKNKLYEESRYHPEIFEELDQALSSNLRMLEEELSFISKVNKPGFLPDDDLERLRQIKNKSYTDIDGRERPYLTDFEFENLSVRKGNLTVKEREEIQSHVQHTLNIVGKIPFPKNLMHIPEYAGCHHEMLNGDGYPNKLKGEEIPLQAKILSAIDIYDALTAADRPYKKAIPTEKALDILRFEVKDNHLDKDIVELFINKKLYEGVV